jgi:hypothetical protein
MDYFAMEIGGREKYYFAKEHSDYTKAFSETDIIKMREFSNDNIFAMFDGRVTFIKAVYP